MSLLPPTRANRRVLAYVARNTEQTTNQTSLWYALALILLVQTLLFTCIAASMGGYVLLTLADMLMRVQAGEAVALQIQADQAGAGDTTFSSPLPMPTASPTALPTPTLFATLLPAQIDTPTLEPTWTPGETGLQTPVAPATGIEPVSPLPTNIATAAPGTTPPSIDGVSLRVIENYDQRELLEVYNVGGAGINISNWTITGSSPDDTVSCTIPAGIMLTPGGTYIIATGESPPLGAGFKCSDRAIWLNEGEWIYLRAVDGRSIQVYAELVGP